MAGSLVSEVCRIADMQDVPNEKPKDKVRLKLIAYRDYTGKRIGWDVHHKGKLVWKIFD